MSLFVDGEFKSHSGLRLPFKIDCDVLRNDDLGALAIEVAKKYPFNHVYGVPFGGLRFAWMLNSFVDHKVDRLLIVDDVLTTGESMQEARERFSSGFTIDGVVIFARGPCPDWVHPIFRLWD